MLSWVITCHDDWAQEILNTPEKKRGALLQCRAVNFWRGLTSNMLSHMVYDALYKTDSGGGVTFLTDIAEAPPYRVVLLSSHEHSRCEAISGVTLLPVEQTMACRETMTSSASREHIVKLGAPEVSSLWHQQQKNPSFVSKHNSYEY